MSEPNPLGKLIEGDAERDAVHVAIEPAVAGEYLLPGDKVGVKNGIASSAGVIVGIVDPFLSGRIAPGARFYVCLFPNTVTGMRHHWEHPAFPENLPTEEQAKDKSTQQHDSEKWLRQYAARLNSYDAAETAFQKMLEGLRSGDLHCRGNDLYSESDLDFAEDFKFHAERYLGIKIDFGKFIFSCSC